MSKEIRLVHGLDQDQTANEGAFQEIALTDESDRQGVRARREKAEHEKARIAESKASVLKRISELTDARGRLKKALNDAKQALDQFRQLNEAQQRLLSPRTRESVEQQYQIRLKEQQGRNVERIKASLVEIGKAISDQAYRTFYRELKEALLNLGQADALVNPLQKPFNECVQNLILLMFEAKTSSDQEVSANRLGELLSIIPKQIKLAVLSAGTDHIRYHREYFLHTLVCQGHQPSSKFQQVIANFGFTVSKQTYDEHSALVDSQSRYLRAAVLVATLNFMINRLEFESERLELCRVLVVASLLLVSVIDLGMVGVLLLKNRVRSRLDYDERLVQNEEDLADDTRSARP